MRGLTRSGKAMAALAVIALAGCGATASAPGSAATSPSTGSPPATSAPAQRAESAAAKPAASAAARAAASPAQSAAPAASVTVRMGASQNVVGNAPVWITKQAELFQKAGVTVDLQSINATTAIKQLVAGQLDAIAAGAPESISARSAGSPIQIVGVFVTACDMEMVTPAAITAIEQVKGKTVGVITKPSVNGVCTVADLRKHGMEPDKDYRIVESGSASGYASLVAIMQAHNVDAGAVQPDLAHKLNSSGQFHTLYDLATEPGLLTAASSLTFSSAFIQAHPVEVQKTLDAFLMGEAYFKQNKRDAQALLKNTFKITEQAQLDETYARQVQLMAKDITPRAELFPDLIDALGQIQPDVRKMDLSGLLVQKFAQDAMQRGLTTF